MTYSPRPSKVTNQIVYDELVRAARAGEPCPCNSRLKELLGAKSIGTAARAVARLADQGRIRLTAHTNSREIYVVELDILMLSASMLDTRTGSKREAEAAAWRAREALAEPLPPVVDRDPCFHCGVRGDLQCEHTPAWKRVTATGASA